MKAATRFKAVLHNLNILKNSNIKRLYTDPFVCIVARCCNLSPSRCDDGTRHDPRRVGSGRVVSLLGLLRRRRAPAAAASGSCGDLAVSLMVPACGLLSLVLLAFLPLAVGLFVFVLSALGLFRLFSLRWSPRLGLLSFGSSREKALADRLGVLAVRLLCVQL